jgi:pyruvate/2-oxoglutarate/acetoin dehydrogenase E1 component
MTYRDELQRTMAWLGEQPDTLFIGQAVGYPGTAMTATLSGVPKDKLVELPVAEEMQMGMSTGLALAGFVPISIYPRWNFLLLATSQLVGHLDKLPIYSNGGYKPKVIIRTASASRTPIDPQSQHLGNYSDPFCKMLKTVEVIECDRADQIFAAYRKGYEREDGRSTLIVEFTQRYA